MKTGSYDRIDYSLRPAKHAERRMLSEVFRKLRPFGRIEDYLYVGLGSIWFSDFSLFHRSLGVQRMISIEKHEEDQTRFEDNKPFAAIEMDFRESSKVLPELLWDKPAFVWLDYDDPIAKGMLLDVQTVVRNAVSGTIIAVTIQCTKAPEAPNVGQEPPEGEPSPMERFRDRLGVQAVPPGKAEDDMRGWPFGALSREIFMSEIAAALATRNLDIDQQQQLEFAPICDIEYADGAKMTTLVGVLATVADRQKVQNCGFDALDFLRADRQAIRIEVPILTVKEIRDLERQLPLKVATAAEYGSMPKDHADNFMKFYRYFPNFAVLEQ